MQKNIVLALMGTVIFAGTLLLSTDISLAQGKTIDAQYTESGTASCLRCHSGENIAVMAETAHGDVNDPHAPYAQKGCESCHGPGSLHVSRARGGAGFPALLIFGDRRTRPEQNAACLDCHGKDMGDVPAMEWTGSKHDTPRMTCVGCHAMHTTDKPLATREGQVENCSRCHEDEIASHPTFERQGIVLDKLNCADCHDVHQLNGLPEDETG